MMFMRKWFPIFCLTLEHALVICRHCKVELREWREQRDNQSIGQRLENRRKLTECYDRLRARFEAALVAEVSNP